MSRQSSLADLAEAFGRCVARSAPPAKNSSVVTPPARLRRIARLMDRLARCPTSRTWHRRVARVHGEIETILRGQTPQVRAGSIWATA